MSTRICRKCKKEKPVEEFCKSNNKTSGKNKRCKECYNAYMRDYYKRSDEYKIKLHERDKEYRRRLRIEVLSHYSKGIPTCTCCGEAEYEFLTIDHMVRGQGPEHRRAGIASKHLLHWLRKNGFPSGFRVLCMNCNFAMGVHGYCPHQKKEAGFTPASLSA
jgi:hypothetical protein